jgi:hypothetical protein
MNRNELLKAANTRQLLAALKRYRHVLAADDEEYDYNIPINQMTTGNIQVEYRYSQAEVKAELATRPHIPNKNEARGLRMQRIKASV